jgi:predicted nucleic acid-binding protein
VVLPVTLADTDRARGLLPVSAGLSVRDALHATVTLNNAVTEIACFDDAFDMLAGIRRLDVRHG